MSLTTCRGCGLVLPAHVQFCSNCGIRLEGPPTDPASPHAAPSEPTRRRNETRRLILTAVVTCLIAFVARMAYTAATSDPKQEGELVAQLPVGPEGGSASFDGDGKITVPKGAVDKPQTITVRRSVMRNQLRAIDPSGGAPLVIPPGTIFIYILGPVDIVLLRPVTLTLPAPPAPARGLVFVSANSRVTFVPGTQRGATITVRLTSFDFAQGPSVFVNRSS